MAPKPYIFHVNSVVRAFFISCQYKSSISNPHTCAAMCCSPVFRKMVLPHGAMDEIVAAITLHVCATSVFCASLVDFHLGFVFQFDPQCSYHSRCLTNASLNRATAAGTVFLWFMRVNSSCWVGDLVNGFPNQHTE